MLDRTAQTAWPPGDAGGCLVVFHAGREGGGVRVGNRRLLRLEPAVKGLTPSLAPDVLRRLLPVCGWAQGIACRRALDAATAAPSDPATETARARLLLAETALTRLWCMAIDWPALVGHGVLPGPVRHARTALGRLASALWPDGSPLTTMAGPVTTAADDICRQIADLLDAACAGLPDHPAELAAWAATGQDMSATLLRQARALVPWPGLHADAPMPGLATVAPRLVAEPGFGLSPDAGGRPAEPGPLHALPEPERQACAELGPVAGRLAAAMFDGRHIARNLRQTGGLPPIGAPAPLPDGWGAGTAATARGPLAQALRVEGGRIAAFRSVAPTEWTLHPDGALMRCLAALPSGATEADMRMVFAAFDPCAPLVFAERATEDA